MFWLVTALHTTHTTTEEWFDIIAPWAFGEDWKTIPISDLYDVWNKRHTDAFTLYGTDLIEESLIRIIQEYKKLSLEG